MFKVTPSSCFISFITLLFSGAFVPIGSAEASPQARALEFHVVKLTSSATGRSPGTAGHQEARVYLEERMKAYGLSPSGLADGADGFLVKEYFKPTAFRAALGGIIGYGFPIAVSGPSEPEGYAVYNLVGVMKSKDPEVKKWRLLIAHYDHLGVKKGRLYRGALDNGTGLAVALEVMRAMHQKHAASNSPPAPANIMFAFTDREEISNLGTAIIGARLLKSRIETRWGNLKNFTVVAMDLLGTKMVEGAALDFFVMGHEKMEKSCPPLAPYFARATAAGAELHYTCAPISLLEGARFPVSLFPQNMLDRCDYAPFRDVGVPSLFLTSGSPWFYHTPEDKPERLNYENLAAITHFLSGLLLGPDLERLAALPAETPNEGSYDPILIKEIAALKTSMLQAREFYRLTPKEIQILEGNRAHLLTCTASSCSKMEVRNEIFDLLRILHEAGKRMTSNKA